jgi:putative N6-adenine-specific DNA methylase
MIPHDFTNDKSHILVTCPKGLTDFVVLDIKEAGLPVIGQFPTGVRTRGTLNDCMTLNLVLSTGHHVLYQVLAQNCTTPDELYSAVFSLEWERLIPLETTLTVTSTVQTASITDTRFANLRCKDAIVDRLAAKTGRRCDSGPRRDGAVVHVYWRDERCMLYVDTSGETLARRGYRLLPGSAPMQETLASGVVRATQWNETMHFINPMCGSGTLAIEAALLAIHRKPGTLRDNFGFMHLIPFDRDSFQKLRKRLREQEHTAPRCPIIATDIDAGAVANAVENARAAHVESFVEFAVCEFDQTKIPEGKGVVVINPEYGYRLGSPEKLQAVYAKIGDFLKQRCTGNTGYVFSGNFDLVKKIGLKARRKVPFVNGTIECRLYEYELYRGTRTTAG